MDYIQAFYIIWGILPFDEFSIQPQKLIKPDLFDPALDALDQAAVFSVGKWIAAKITSMSSGKIYLSRKRNQQKTFEHFLIGQSVICQVTSLAGFAAFVDIGEGIVAIAHISELSVTRYKDINKWLHIGEKFLGIITSISEDGKIIVSRKEYHLGHDISLNRNQAILAKVGSPLPDGTGYFVEITPSISGIMNSERDVEFEEAQEVICCVRRYVVLNNGNIGYKLSFVGFPIS